MKNDKVVVNDEVYLIVNILDKSERKISKIKECLSTFKNNSNGNIKGIIIISNSNRALVKAEFLNKDGSNGILSANGMICISKYLLERKYINSTCFEIETLLGNRVISFNEIDGKIEKFDVNLGRGNLNPKKIPMLCEKGVFIDEPIFIDNKLYNFIAVSMGNPHLISFVSDIDKVDIESLGPMLECHYLFPEHTNVEFAQIIDKENIKVKLWERGCGISKSCGTASAAVVYAGIVSGRLQLESEYIVHTDDETQEVYLDENLNLHLVNPYHKVYKK